MARELGSGRVSKWEGKRRIRVRVLDVIHLVERDFRVLESGGLVQSTVKRREMRGVCNCASACEL
jgi:hypothetical protein